MIFLPGMSSIGMVVCSMIGSALGAGIVFGFGSLLQNGLSPVRLAIIGTVIGTFLSSVSLQWLHTSKFLKMLVLV